MTSAKKKIVVFASGNGSNFQSIIDQVKSGYLQAQIILLISDKEDAVLKWYVLLFHPAILSVALTYQ